MDDELKQFLDNINKLFNEINNVNNIKQLREIIKEEYEYELMIIKKNYRDHIQHLPNDNIYKKQICYIMNILDIRFENLNLKY